MNFCSYFPQCARTALSVSESPFAGTLILIRVVSCLFFNVIVVGISVYTLRFKGSFFIFYSFFNSFYVKENSVCLSLTMIPVIMKRNGARFYNTAYISLSHKKLKRVSRTSPTATVVSSEARVIHGPWEDSLLVVRRLLRFWCTQFVMIETISP
jgi:hypothetical protein